MTTQINLNADPLTPGVIQIFPIADPMYPGVIQAEINDDPSTPGIVQANINYDPRTPSLVFVNLASLTSGNPLGLTPRGQGQRRLTTRRRQPTSARRSPSPSRRPTVSDLALQRALRLAPSSSPTRATRLSVSKTRVRARAGQCPRLAGRSLGRHVRSREGRPFLPLHAGPDFVLWRLLRLGSFRAADTGCFATF
jgi:hypothetical protein